MPSARRRVRRARRDYGVCFCYVWVLRRQVVGHHHEDSTPGRQQSRSRSRSRRITARTALNGPGTVPITGHHIPDAQSPVTLACYRCRRAGEGGRSSRCSVERASHHQAGLFPQTRVRPALLLLMGRSGGGSWDGRNWAHACRRYPYPHHPVTQVCHRCRRVSWGGREQQQQQGPPLHEMSPASR
jgi:hypothetical protein